MITQTPIRTSTAMRSKFEPGKCKGGRCDVRIMESADFCSGCGRVIGLGLMERLKASRLPTGFGDKKTPPDPEAEKLALAACLAKLAEGEQ